MSRPLRLSRPGEPAARAAGPVLRGAARPGFVGEAIGAALLAGSGPPLSARRRRRRDRLGGRLAGSGLLHLLALVLLSISFVHDGGHEPQDATPVEMMYDRPGSSGAQGQPAPNPGAGAPTLAKPLPDLLPPQPVPPVEAPEAPPVPEAPQAETLPPPRAMPRPSDAARSSSAFSHPMNLSFAPMASPSHRAGRTRSGSNGSIDLSLGPMVQNGRMLTPYASTTSIKGVSDDYAEEIDNWIRRHMYYPEDAAQRGEEGPSSVHVVLDRQGRVTGIRLVTSSGSYALDDATQGMFRNAVLPPVPPDMTGKTFDVDLTIDYILIRR